MDKAFIESYYQTYNSEDADALAAFYHDDVELTSSQGVMRGPQAILETYRYLTSNFLDQMTPEDIVISGDTAVVTIVDKFTAKNDVDDFMGMSVKKGEGFELRLRGSYEMEDGKFRRISLEMLES